MCCNFGGASATFHIYPLFCIILGMTDTSDAQKRNADLHKTQEDLIARLKTRHKELYDWLSASGIDLTNLKTYAYALSVLAIMSFHTVTAKYDRPILEDLSGPVTVIELNELQGLDENQKAELVWNRYGHVIKRDASKYDLDPKVIYATIMTESMGNTYAVRQEPSINDASYGLGQLLYGTSIGLGFQGNADELFDPETNIDLICRYHARTKSIYGEDLTASQLAIAYNSGNPYGYPLYGHVEKFGKWMTKAESFIL